MLREHRNAFGAGDAMLGAMSSSSSGARRVRVLVVLAVAVAALAGALAFALTRDGGSQHTQPSVRLSGQAYPGRQLREAVQGLCSVAVKARSSVRGAYDEFLNRSHQDLHVIAGAAQKRDRRTAARLLVAMEALEADFESSAPPPRVAHQTGRLIRSADQALKVLGIEPVGCS